MPSVRCRIHGLTSDTGRPLNGSMAHVNIASPPSGGRIGVMPDGRAKGLALRPDNLTFSAAAVGPACTLGVGIARGMLREDTFNAALVRHPGSIDHRIHPFSGSDCPRAEGNLHVLAQYFGGDSVVRLRQEDIRAP